MEEGQRQVLNKGITEWANIFISFLLVFIAVSTCILDQKKSNWICGPVLIILEIIAIAFQVTFSIIIWKTKKKNIKLILAIISFMLLTFIVWNFLKFLTNCS